MATRSERLEAKLNPRSITAVERPWIDKWSTATQTDLLEKLNAAGVSRRIAWGVAGYLGDRAAGARADIVTNSTKARYRKLLLLVGPPIMFDIAA